MNFLFVCILYLTRNKILKYCWKKVFLPDFKFPNTSRANLKNDTNRRTVRLAPLNNSREVGKISQL